MKEKMHIKDIGEEYLTVKAHCVLTLNSDLEVTKVEIPYRKLKSKDLIWNGQTEKHEVFRVEDSEER